MSFFFFSSRRRHTRFDCDWSSDVCSSDLWSAVAGLLSAGLAEAPGLAGAPSDALAALGFLDPDLGARFRSAGAGLPVSEALSAVVLAAAAERPVLLALDDAHWIDGGTLAA